MLNAVRPVFTKFIILPGFCVESSISTNTNFSQETLKRKKSKSIKAQLLRFIRKNHLQIFACFAFSLQLRKYFQTENMHLNQAQLKYNRLANFIFYRLWGFKALCLLWPLLHTLAWLGAQLLQHFWCRNVKYSTD